MPFEQISKRNSRDALAHKVNGSKLITTLFSSNRYILVINKENCFYVHFDMKIAILGAKYIIMLLRIQGLYSAFESCYNIVSIRFPIQSKTCFTIQLQLYFFKTIQISRFKSFQFSQLLQK